MRSLPEENVVREFFAGSESLNFICLLVQPFLAALRQLVERAGKLIVPHELQGQPLECQKYGGKRTRHDRAGFIGPRQLEGMGTKFFERALRIAGYAQRLNCM